MPPLLCALDDRNWPTAPSGLYRYEKGQTFAKVLMVSDSCTVREMSKLTVSPPDPHRQTGMYLMMSLTTKKLFGELMRFCHSLYSPRVILISIISAYIVARLASTRDLPVKRVILLEHDYGELPRLLTIILRVSISGEVLAVGKFWRSEEH